MFHQFLPDTPDRLDRGRARFGAQLDVINNLLAPAPAGSATVVEDNEYQRLLLSWRHGVARDSEIAVFLPLLWRNGGFLDSILSAWHSFWGIPDNFEDDPAGRRNRRDYQSVLLLKDRFGTTLVDSGSAFGPGDVSVTLKHGLIRGNPRSNLAIRIGLKLPTGNPGMIMGSGGFDAGISLDGRYNIGRDVIAYGNVAGIAMSRATRVPGSRSAMIQYAAAFEYRPNSRDSFIWQIDGSSAAVRTGNSFADRLQATGTFGYKRRLNRSITGYVSFSENGDYHSYSIPLLGNVGPDFTATIGIEWRR